MVSSQEALVAALLAALREDARLSAIVGGRIYDAVPRDARGEPSDAVAPYVYLGPVAWSRIEAGCGPLLQFGVRFYSVSTRFARAEVWAAHDAMRAALDWRELALADGHVLVALRAMAGGDVTNPLSPRECFLDLSAQVADANASPS